MTFFDYEKSVLENLNFASGPILAILGFLIIYQILQAKKQIELTKIQLKEAKNELVINSLRDSIKLSAEQINYYMETIVNYANISDIKFKESNLKRVKFETKNFLYNELISKANEIDKDYSKKYNDLVAYDLNTLNSLETFSTYFTNKIADEKIAYLSVGKSFCNIIENLYYPLCVSRKNDNDYYQNIVILYRLWKARLSKSILENKEREVKSELSQKIKDINAQKNKIDNFEESKPLGTEM